MRILYLDGIRGLLALAVAFSHIYGSLVGWGTERWMYGAYLAVDYFFILSGFVLTYVLSNQQISHSKWILIRFLRLWPLHVFCFAAMVAVYVLNGRTGGYVPSYDIWSFRLWLMNVFFLGNLGLVSGEIINPPAWSIGIEFWLSAILLPFLVRLSSYILFGSAAIIYCLILLHSHDGLAIASDIAPYTNGGLLRGFAGMCLGVAMFKNEAYFSGKLIELGQAGTHVLFCTCAALCVLGLLVGNAGPADVVYVALFLPFLAVSAFRQCGGVLFKFLASPVLVWFGAISFVVYLLHTPVYVLFIRYSHSERFGPYWASVLLMLMVIVASTFVHMFAERPAMQISRKILRRLYPASSVKQPETVEVA